jgi:hypothetical protein
LQGILYEETTFFAFLLVTGLMGGATAWMTGRACAKTWRPVPILMFYLLILGFGVRFIHFAVFHGTLLQPWFYAVDTVFLIVVGYLGFRYTRDNQMVNQYYWLYDRAGPIGWKPKV